jgi:hypothetical protein
MASSGTEKMRLYSEIISNIKHNSRKTNNRSNQLLPSQFRKTQQPQHIREAMRNDQREKCETKLNPVGKRFIRTRLRAGRCGVRIPAGARDVSLLVMLQTGCGAI